ncbi:tripartite motif-containing protein 3-like isoform X2 [Bolinopsis microptera]|uniref:tripartite motif-containing protein 3-like isoform X2 n=1 Tax=Bolinopsis microptera TaxID=2820187 RepID=UPI003079F3F2
MKSSTTSQSSMAGLLQSAAVSERIDLELRCPICLDRYGGPLKAPRALPCLHSLCSACLTIFIKNERAGSLLNCPTCRQPFSVPFNGTFGFPVNLSVNNLLEIADLLTLERGEDRRTLSKIRVCKNHRTEIIKMYCKECQESCCTLCAVTTHKLHQTLTLTQASEEIRTRLRSIDKECTSSQAELDVRLNHVSSQKGMLEGSTATAKKLITESVEQCITAIKSREKNLMAALDRDKRLSQEILNRQRERLISKRTALEKRKQKVLETLHCSDVELMKTDVEFSAPSTPTTVFGETKNIVFEPHNLDNICRAARSLGDPNIVLSLQTGSSALTGQLVGGKGTESGEFQYPLGLRSHGGALYIADAGNNRVQILNSTLQHELSITSDGDSSPFDRPNDVCIDKNGMIIVADTFRNSLHWYTQEGCHQRTLTGILNRPFSVCVNSENSVVVADTGNHRVRVISQSGKRNLVFGKYGKEEGDFDGPHSVAVDKYDNIYVADLYNQRLQVFDSEGKYLRTIGSNLHLQAPRSIAINRGKIYIVDWGYTFIQVLNLKGAQLLQFGVYTLQGEQITPNSIATDPEDRLYVSDCNNHKVYMVKMENT